MINLMPLSENYLAIAALIPLAVLSAFFIWCLISYLKSHNKQDNTKNTEPYLSAIEAKGYNVLHQAIKKAEAILGKAELEGIKVVADSKFRTGQLETKYDAEISSAVARMEGSFAAEIEKSEKEFVDYLADLRTRSEQTSSLLEDVTRQRVSDLFARFENSLASFLSATQQQSIEAIDLELKTARQMIESYKTSQLTLVDENVIAILERTLNLVLTKKLPIKDHIDLIKEALEQAKVEKFII